VLRLLVSPKWITWHVLTLGAMVACGFLSAWQWHRAGEAMGSALNIGYGVQWPIFAVFFGFMWWHFLRMEVQQLREAQAARPVAEAPVVEVEPADEPAEVPAPRPEPVEPPEPVVDDRPSPFTPRPAGIEPSRLSDPQIRAYNDALAELAARDQEK
jgi:DNA-binding transcriptional regulator of glucitol operon